MTHHNFPPVWDENSKIIILGSFPSVRSRSEGFYYAHRQNRFWKVLADLFGRDDFHGIEEKKEFLLTHGIALWDVVASCDITGSSDSSIKNVVPNDLSEIISSSCVKTFFTNGKTAGKLYDKYLLSEIQTEDICLPSTSPANAAFSLDALALKWSCILDYLK